MIGISGTELPHRGFVGGRLTLDNTDVINNAGSGIILGGASLPSVSDSDVSGNADGPFRRTVLWWND